MILAVSSIFWALFGLAMAAIALSSNPHRGARRGGALMLGLVIAVGLVAFWTNERSERRAPRAAEVRSPEKKIARARVEFARARDKVRQATDELQVTLRTELPELKELGQKIRDAIKTGVRIEDQKLVFGPGAVAPAAPVPPRPPNPLEQAEADSDEDALALECDSALAIAIATTGADNLARYFADLAERPAAGRTEELRQLRAALLELSPAERQALAERIAQDAEDAADDVAPPRTVGKQIERRRRPPPVPPLPDLMVREQVGPRLKGGIVAALTVVALSAATAILKTATRRHSPRPR